MKTLVNRRLANSGLPQTRAIARPALKPGTLARPALVYAPAGVELTYTFPTVR
jgi:hypothetical protein